MRLTWTFVERGRRPASTDVEVEAPVGTTFAEVLVASGRSVEPYACADQDVPPDAPVGEPPLLDGAVLLRGPVRVATRPGALELRVVAGPDCGAVRRLGPGEHRIGRDARCDVRIEDPDVSRVHAVVHVDADEQPVARVHDAGSTNGTSLDGTVVSGAGRGWRPGEELRIGSSRIRLHTTAHERASCHADGTGHVGVNRPPRSMPRHAPATVSFPAPAAVPETTRFPLSAAAVPLVAGVALVAATRSTTYLAFVLLSPLMMVGSYVGDRLAGRRSALSASRTHASARAAAVARLQQALAEESAGRHREHPDPAQVLACARGPGPRLWERRPDDDDFLELRVGRGCVVARTETRAVASDDADGVDDAPPLVTDVPVPLSLPRSGVVGVAGPREWVLRLARYALGQLACWHSPRHVRLVVLGLDGGSDWVWARWLPHLRDDDSARQPLLVGFGAEQVAARIATLQALVDQRRAAASGGGRWAGPSTVVLLDGAGRLRREPGVARLLGEGPSVGVHALCLDEDIVSLPVECRATAVHESSSATPAVRVVDERADLKDDVALDGVSPGWALELARALAPLRDATPADRAARLPRTVRLLDLLDIDATDPAALRDKWQRSPRGTVVPVGRSGEGAVVVDLATDGPHALVAGTTGSGKSELLQTLVAGLAVQNRPDALSFVLVDYKGGAAFGDCARLPHTVGMVTDLDGRLTERALASLRAELRRRERVLATHRCPDLVSYLASDADPAVLPRLVIVVDEFAGLAEELPAFLGGLVATAQRGRSLGVHLVLATQRPAGVVSADIRANTSLRMALRVTDAVESVDVVEVPDAARISSGTPGRVVLRRGSGTELVQVAHVGGRQHDSPRVTVRPVPWHSAGVQAADEEGAGGDGPSDLQRLVDAAVLAAAGAGPAVAPCPWLPPLPALLAAASLPAGAVGLLDRPDQQRQDPWRVDDIVNGHLLVVGGPRSGRTTALRTIAGRLAAGFGPDALHIYALDSTGGLAALETFPHTGAVVGRDEPDRACRVLDRLAGLVARPATSGSTSTTSPSAVLLVDGWSAWTEALEDVEHGRALDVLQALVRDGAGAGLRVFLTGDRSLLASRAAAGCSRRLVLPMPDPADAVLAGVPSTMVPSGRSPGRGLLMPDLIETQVAHLGADAAASSQDRALRALGASLAWPSQGGPRRVVRLPRVVAVEDIAAEAEEVASGPAWALVGVGGDDASPLGVDLDAYGPAFVVAGAPGSGRSTALLTIGGWLLGQDRRLLVVAADRSPLRELAGHPGVTDCLTAVDGDVAADRLAAAPRTVVLVDDAERLTDSPVEPALLALLAADAGGRLVLAGDLADLGAAYRGVLVEARRSRSGLLLGTWGPGEGDLLGVRVPRPLAGPVGRGVLVRRGRLSPVQVATSTRSATAAAPGTDMELRRPGVNRRGRSRSSHRALHSPGMARSGTRSGPQESSFATLLRELRDAAGLSQEELAARAHLTVHAVSALERGLRTRPYPSTVRSLAAALDVSDQQRAALLAAVGRRGRDDGAVAGSQTRARAAAVPAPTTRLVAREDELAALVGLLRERGTRVVTVTGLGGVGKTRLATAAATELAGDVDDVLWVALAPVLEAGLVLPAVADAAGAEVTDDVDPVAAVAAIAAERRTLLVLDNVEHVLAAGPDVARLVEACPQLRVLATSRAPLRIRGEQELLLAPLALPDPESATPDTVEASPAGALFLERARSIAPGLRLGERDAAAVAGICARLAGIPLALELAAAHARVLEPQTLLARLDDAVALDGARDLPARQRTMTATLDWSYGLLAPDEQVMLRIVSVFAGGFTLEAAEAVASAARVVPAQQVLGLVQSLVEQSLVLATATPTGRRFVLLEPVAQYARARLQEDPAADAVAAAHTAYLLGLAERAAPEYQRADQVVWLDRVAAEHADLTGAMARATAAGDGETAGRLSWALWLYWWLRGHSLQGRRQVEAALELEMPDDVRARAEIAAATTAYRLGDVAASERHWATGLAIATARDDPLSQANAVAGLGLVALTTGSAEDAERHLGAALALAEGVGEPAEWLRGLVLVWLGTVATMRGGPEEAIALVERGLASARERGDRLTAYIALYNLSQSASAIGDHDAARRYLEEGTRLSVETGDLANLTYFCDALAVVEAAVGAHERVPLLLGAAEALRESVDRAGYGYYRPDVDAVREAAARSRERLGDERYDDALDRGRDLDPDDAVRAALGEAV